MAGLRVAGACWALWLRPVLAEPPSEPGGVQGPPGPPWPAEGERLLERALAGRAGLAEVAGCSRRSAIDLGPALARLEEEGAGRACGRVARQLYCEAVLDVFSPVPFESTCQPSGLDEEAGASEPAMELRSEGGVRIAVLIFMVDETHAVREILAYLGPQDSALVHVDARQPAAFAELSSWASSKPRVRLSSRWAVERTGYSAGASLLDLLDEALEELPAWDVLLFLSASHFPIRPRWELERFLWYHPVSFVSSEEGQLRFEQFSELHHHLQLGFECEGRLLDPLWSGSARSPLLVGLGHPNVTVAQGPPFVALRRDFVRWLGAARRQRGSPAWVLLRHTLRTWCNVEKVMQTLVQNTEWCNRTNLRHDLTVARQGPGEQEAHHMLRGPDDGFSGPLVLSASLLGPSDFEGLQEVRRDRYVETGFPGFQFRDSGRAPGGHARHRGLSPAFAAFARKVSPELRQLLAQGPAFEAQAWHPWPRWPLAERLWQLAAPCGPSAAGAGLRALRRDCGRVGDRAPCAAELLLSAEGCGSRLRVRERVAVGSGRVYAVQVGLGWSAPARAFAAPGVVPASGGGPVRAELFAEARSAGQLERRARVRALFRPPGGLPPFLVEPAFDLRDGLTGGGVSFRPEGGAKLAAGEWAFVLEALGERDVRSPLSGRSLAERPFHVYEEASRLDEELLRRYFDWATEGEEGAAA